MPRTDELSSRERVRLALEHQETDRIPIAMVCSGINPPAQRELEIYLQQERGTDVASYLAPLLDIKQIGPSYVGPSLPAGQDIWGVQRQAVSYGTGSYSEIMHHPLGNTASMEAIVTYPWPNTDFFDYSVLPERIASAQAEGDYCLMVSNGNLFETAWYMRGFEQMFMDFALNPELAHSIMRHVTDFYVTYFTEILSAAPGQIDLAFTADDIGGQNGLLMSLEMWKEFIKPYHIRLNRAIHDFGVKVIYHTDGAIMDAVDGLVDMGIDVLQALQFSAQGMDPVALKSRYGDRLCFQGGVSVQTTLPFGKVAEVKTEVEHLIRVLGKNGGYILGPSHAIQAGTPPENIVAMFDTAAAFSLR